jgi:hypothetical protein
MAALHDPTRTLVRREFAGAGAITFELDPSGVLRRLGARTRRLGRQGHPACHDDD